jgi:hypothetical protein
MKQKLLITLLFVTGMSFSLANAQQLFIWQKDGTTSTVELNTVQTIKFSSGNLLINTISGTTNSFSIAANKKLTFDKATAIESIVYKNPTNSISIYYNASEDVVSIRNLPAKNSPVIIYQLNGVTAMSSQVSSGSPSFDVSGLHSGFYLLKVNNAVFKFIKQ